MIHLLRTSWTTDEDQQRPSTHRVWSVNRGSVAGRVSWGMRFTDHNRPWTWKRTLNQSLWEEEGSDGFASEEEQELDDPPIGAPLELNVRARNVAIGMASLDEFDLPEIFKHRARVMRTVPLFLKGAFRGALRVAFEEAQCARDTNDDARNSRAWKLFMLLPRMLLEQARSRRITPQETVGGTFLDVQCRAVGGTDQG